MRAKTFAVFLALAAVVLLFAQRHQPPAPQPAFRAVIDLTQPLSEKFPNWEGTEKSPFEARPLGRIEKDGYFSRHISLPEHFATHMDAPAHFAAGAWTVDQIPPERLIGPLVVLDVTAQTKANADYQIRVE
ncbi:MAG: cyclase family protein, partial [Terriglobales bacterium]